MPNAQDQDPEFAAKLKKYREREAAETAAIKGKIEQWVEPFDNPSSGVNLTRALLDLAFDRHVAIHDDNGFDLIEWAYQRALTRLRGPLQ